MWRRFQSHRRILFSNEHRFFHLSQALVVHCVQTIRKLVFTLTESTHQSEKEEKEDNNKQNSIRKYVNLMLCCSQTNSHSFPQTFSDSSEWSGEFGTDVSHQKAFILLNLRMPFVKNNWKPPLFPQFRGKPVWQDHFYFFSCVYTHGHSTMCHCSLLPYYSSYYRYIWQQNVKAHAKL